MSKTQSLIEDDYNPEETVEFDDHKQASSVKDEVLPSRTAKEVWLDLGTQSKIVLVCTFLICFTLTGFGIAGIVVGGVTEYQLPNNSTVFAREIAINHTFNYWTGGNDWCTDTAFMASQIPPPINLTVQQYFDQGTPDTAAKKSLAYGAVLVVSAIFLGVFGFDGVVQENKYELIMFILIAYFCLIRVGWQFFSFLREAQAPDYQYIADTYKMNPLNWTAGGIALANLAFVIYTTYQTVRLFRSGDFNWIRYRLVGLTDKRLESYYDVYQFFIGVLKLDIQFNFSLVVLSGAFLFANIQTSYAFWVNIAVVFFTIGWSAFVTFAVRRERATLVWVALGFTVAEPAYIIYKLYFLLNKGKGIDCNVQLLANSSPVSLFIVSGVLAVACRVVLVILIIKCMRNFGPGGLKEKVWDREEALTQRSNKSSASYNTYK